MSKRTVVLYVSTKVTSNDQQTVLRTIITSHTFGTLETTYRVTLLTCLDSNGLILSKGCESCKLNPEHVRSLLKSLLC